MNISNPNRSGKVGFACKYMHHDQKMQPKQLKEVQQDMNFRGTTIKWLRENFAQSQNRVVDIIRHNVAVTGRMVEYVGSLPVEQRMLRLGSDMIPAYTEPTFGSLSKSTAVSEFLALELGKIGDRARELGVRLSMHPGQFCVLASVDEGIVQRSIEEFEYHVDIARLMGYGKQWQDFKINVHISGRQGPDGIKAVLGKLTPEARNCITIENDENSWGIEASLELEKHVALVLDIHHHWCKTGEYIPASDDRVKRIKDSWRGVRPVLHYSVSREDYLVNHPVDVLPDMAALLASGHKKAHLRAHSDYMWNTAVNDWAQTFWDDFDVMVEAKCKNLASTKLHSEWIA